MEQKELEISLGAFDSVLGGWEYTIPEGYEALIEDGKVIVRKIEREDEKIKKAIIDVLKAVYECADIAFISQKQTLDSYVAYLEKHSESTEKEKSLKDKYAWKPSNEQMKGIECAIKTLRHQLNVGDKRLNSLYDDLKKLKGEQV